MSVTAGTVIELKAKGKTYFNSDALGKLANYLATILTNQPWRTFAVGALYNGRITQFLHATRSNDTSGIDIKYSGVYNMTDTDLFNAALRGLYTILYRDLCYVGWVPLESTMVCGS